MEAVSNKSPSTTASIKIEEGNLETADHNHNWIDVNVERVPGFDGHPYYQICFRTSAGIEWRVNHRFRVFRQLMWDLRDRNGTSLGYNFPPTFLKSKFGFSLTIEELNSRTNLLLQWINYVLTQYGELDELSRKLLASVFDLRDNDISLSKAYSYLTYMSDTYSATVESSRAPSEDLFERFKGDLLRVRANTAPPQLLKTLPEETQEKNSDSNPHSFRNDNSILAASAASSLASDTALGRLTVV